MAGNKRGPRRKPIERERQRLQCLELYLSGVGQYEIAKKLGMSQSQVSRDIAKAHEEWAKRTTYNLDEEKAKRLAEIDNLERMYHAGYRRTVGTHKLTTKETNLVGENGFDGKTTVKTEKLAGDVAFLNGVLSCISERCRILGTYAATKQITAQVPPKLLAAAQIDSL
jgi:transposase